MEVEGRVKWPMVVEAESLSDGDEEEDDFLSKWWLAFILGSGQYLGLEGLFRAC